MTVKHEHQDYASKTTLRAATTIVLGFIGLLCTILLFSMRKSDAAVEKVYNNDIKIEKHLSETAHLHGTLLEIKADMKEQHKQLSETHDLVIKQGAKIDVLSEKIDACVNPGSVARPDPIVRLNER